MNAYQEIGGPRPIVATTQTLTMETAVALARALLLFLVFQVVVAASTASARPDCVGRSGLLECDGHCKRLGVCLATGDWVVMHDCTANGKVCSRGRCVKWTAECARQTEARCLAEGVFPDLNDCTSYIECANVARTESRIKRHVIHPWDSEHDVYRNGYDEGDGNGDGGDRNGGDEGDGNGGDGDGGDGEDDAAVGTVRHCPTGTVFDACTGHCDMLTTTCAWDVTPVCAQPGHFGVAPHNDRLFYACVAKSDGAIVPYWSSCGFGHFNATTRRCENYGIPGCHVKDGSDDTSVATTAAPPAPTTPEPPPQTTPVKCTIGVYPDPDTDCSYFYCIPDGTYVVVECKSGFHFEESAGMCVDGACTARL